MHGLRIALRSKKNLSLVALRLSCTIKSKPSIVGQRGEDVATFRRGPSWTWSLTPTSLSCARVDPSELVFAIVIAGTLSPNNILMQWKGIVRDIATSNTVRSLEGAESAENGGTLRDPSSAFKFISRISFHGLRGCSAENGVVSSPSYSCYAILYLVILWTRSEILATWFRNVRNDEEIRDRGRVFLLRRLFFPRVSTDAAENLRTQNVRRESFS